MRLSPHARLIGYGLLALAVIALSIVAIASFIKPPVAQPQQENQAETAQPRQTTEPLPATPVAPAANDWRTYTSADAAYQFDYPPDTDISTSEDASQRFNIVYAQFALTATSDYQGISVMVLDNPQNKTAQEFISSRYALAGVRAPDMQPKMGLLVDARPALKLERDAVVGDLDKYTVLIPGVGVMYRINLFGGGDGGDVEPAEETEAVFARLVTSFKVLAQPLLPRTTILAPPAEVAQPPIARVFSFPLHSTADVKYGVPEGNIIDDTHVEWLGFGVRNLDQWGIKCYGVDWTRMLHTGEDWYRLDGANTAGAPVFAVADGVVARHNPGISYPGNVVLIRHRLSNGRDVYSMYGHVANVRVVVGQLVQRGQQIATVINVRYTGRTPSLHPAYDSHVHFEMRYFLDATNIYTPGTNAYGYNYPACKYAYPGRGYTYLISPDRYPYPNKGYINASTFIRARLDPDQKPAEIPDTVTTTKGCVDLLHNGDFEGDAAGRPWAGVANTRSRVYHTSFVSRVHAHAGEHSGQLGSATLNSHWSEIVQTVQLPRRVTSAVLTYWRYLDTTEPTRARANDTFNVAIETEQGLPMPKAQLRIDNTSAGRGAWVKVTLALPNAAAYAGEKVWITFKGATNASYPTALFLDDVQFVVCGR